MGHSVSPWTEEGRASRARASGCPGCTAVGQAAQTRRPWPGPRVLIPGGLRYGHREHALHPTARSSCSLAHGATAPRKPLQLTAWCGRPPPEFSPCVPCPHLCPHRPRLPRRAPHCQHRPGHPDTSRPRRHGALTAQGLRPSAPRRGRDRGHLGAPRTYVLHVVEAQRGAAPRVLQGLRGEGLVVPVDEAAEGRSREAGARGPAPTRPAPAPGLT